MKHFRVKKNKPWFLWILRHFFFPNINWEGGDALVFGNVIYCKPEMSYFLKGHEVTHVQQQNYNAWGALKWWYRYIKDIKFRIDQEAEAYGVQYWLFEKYENDRNKRAIYLDYVCNALSGPLYGNVIKYEEAKRLILKSK